MRPQTQTIDFWGNRDSNEDGGQLDIGLWNAEDEYYTSVPCEGVQPDGAYKWTRPLTWNGDFLPEENEDEDLWREGQYSVQVFRAEDYFDVPVVFTIEAFE